MRRFPRACLAIATALTPFLLSAMRMSSGGAEARVSDLEGRMTALESRVGSSKAVAIQPKGTTVKAPFVVTDDAGVPILSVRADPRGIIITDATGNILVAASALPGNGFVKAISPTQNRTVVMSADATTARLVLRDGPTADRATFTVGPNGRPTVTMLGDSHKPLVELYTVDKGGGGAVKVSDRGGNPIGMLSALEEGGVVKILNFAQDRAAVLGIDDRSAALSLRDGPESSSNRAAISISSDGKLDFGVFSASHAKLFEISQTGEKVSLGVLGAGAKGVGATSNNRVFEVTQEDGGGGRINLSDGSGKTNVSIGALSIGGYFKAQTPDGGRVAILGTETGNALVTLRDGSKNSRATLSLTGDDKPTLALFNASHHDIVSLTESAGGAGVLQLFDAGGKTSVEAGTVASGAGIVNVSPTTCPVTPPLSPPTCIKGWFKR